MRIAYISDLHSNIYAVESLEKDLKKENIDEIRCLGDIVGYGANPKEVVQWVMENCSITLRGNHDTLVSDAEPIVILHPEVLKVAEWTVDQLTDKEIDFLANLEKDYEEENLILTHDEPCMPGSMYYVTSEKDAKDTFSAYSEQFCFYGHTHLPVIFVKDRDTKEVKSFKVDKYKIKENEQYLVNAGSIGQPRDKDPRLSYLIHDTDTNELIYKRVEYDVEKAVQDILNAGLPSMFAYRLREGK